jgi:hypothetical protein
MCKFYERRLNYATSSLQKYIITLGFFMIYVTQIGKVKGQAWRYARAYGVDYKVITQGRVR